MPYIAKLRPLSPAIQTNRLVLHGLVDAEVGGEVVEGPLPVAVLHPVGE
jgi:hypothetical protein